MPPYFYTKLRHEGPKKFFWEISPLPADLRVWKTSPLPLLSEGLDLPLVLLGLPLFFLWAFLFFFVVVFCFFVVVLAVVFCSSLNCHKT